MLTLPLLILLGLPADIANGTNRVAVVAQGVSGTWGFHRKGRVEWRNLGALALPTVLGALGGALLATQVPRLWLKPALLSTLVVVALVMLLRPNWLPDESQGEPRSLRPSTWFGMFATGVYGGFVQAGVGFLLLGMLCGVLRYDLVRGNALKLAVVLVFGTVSLLVFALARQVCWSIGLLLACATVAGSQIGVRTALTIRATTLRWLLFVAVTVSCMGAWLR